MYVIISTGDDIIYGRGYTYTFIYIRRRQRLLGGNECQQLLTARKIPVRRRKEDLVSPLFPGKREREYEMLFCPLCGQRRTSYIRMYVHGIMAYEY
jgi:hypothetical protein